jgi:hypothetical protein
MKDRACYLLVGIFIPQREELGRLPLFLGSPQNNTFLSITNIPKNTQHVKELIVSKVSLLSFRPGLAGLT